MSTVTVPRADLTTEEVVRVLRDALGAGYNMLPGMAMRRMAFRAPLERRPNTIVVGTGENRAGDDHPAGRADRTADQPRRFHLGLLSNGKGGLQYLDYQGQTVRW